MLELIDVRRIWDASPHNAFPDLISFQGQVFLACREGRGHTSMEGALRVARLSEASDGAADWVPVARLAYEEHDLRDPSFSVTPDGRLMILAGSAWRPADEAPSRDGTGTVASFSEDGEHWSEPRVVVQPGRWVWRAAWFEGRAYGFAYGGSSTPGRTGTVASLLTSADGYEWDVRAHELLVDGMPTEVALDFAQDGAALALARRDGGSKTAWLGRSSTPFADWSWSDLGVHLGGPNLIRVPHAAGDRWIAAGRVFEGGEEFTELLELDVARGALTSLLRLPSGGDTSYPGLLLKNGELWVAYYSSHEERTSIYLARLARLARLAVEPA